MHDLPIVHIERDKVTIGGVQLPAEWIEQGGVTVKPGGGTDINRLHITFLVGHIRVDDPTLEGSTD